MSDLVIFVFGVCAFLLLLGGFAYTADELRRTKPGDARH